MGKINSYIGFSIKSGTAIVGLDNVLQTGKVVRLILVDNTLSENTLKKVYDLAKYKKSKLYLIKNDTLSNILNKNNAKVIGLTNKNLCLALLKCEDELEDMIKE